MKAKYFAPHGGHPGQDQLLTDRAVFTDAQAHSGRKIGP